MRSRAIAAAVSIAAIVAGVSGSTASAVTQNQQTTGAPATQPTAHNVTIQPGDTLTKIGVANSTTYIRLYDANTQINDPDLIYSGQSIRIPAPDEQVADRALPAKVKAAAAAAPQALQEAPAKPAVAPVAKPVVAPVARTVAKTTAPAVASNSVWDRLAQCESSGNWSINTGNGFYGGLQFTLSSWKAVGGTGYPNQASREEQINRAQILQSRQGWGAWPACSAKLGLS